MSPIRALILIAIGIFIGTVLTFMSISTLERMHAVPNANMKLMEYHLAQARKASRSNACDAPAAERHLRRVGDLMQDADQIFVSAGYDAREFKRYAKPFNTEVDKGLAAGPDCAAIGAALKPIADACDGCHHAIR